MKRLALVLLTLLTVAGCAAQTGSRSTAVPRERPTPPPSPSATSSARDGDACTSIRGALDRYPTNTGTSMFVSGLWQSASRNLSDADDPELAVFGRDIADARNSSDWELMVIVGQNAFRRCQSLGHTPKDEPLPEPKP